MIIIGRCILMALVLQPRLGLGSLFNPLINTAGIFLSSLILIVKIIRPNTKALIIGLSVLHDLRAARVLIFGNSELVINQLKWNFPLHELYSGALSYGCQLFGRVIRRYHIQTHFSHSKHCHRRTGSNSLRSTTHGGRVRPADTRSTTNAPALVNQQVLCHDHVIRTRVMSLPSLLERGDPVDVCAVRDITGRLEKVNYAVSR